MRPLNEEVRRMQTLAGIKTNESLEEGWKNALAKGLLALTLLGGGTKAYQLADKYTKDQNARVEYAQGTLFPALEAMSPQEQVELANQAGAKNYGGGFMDMNKPGALDAVARNKVQQLKSAMISNPSNFGVDQNTGKVVVVK